MDMQNRFDKKEINSLEGYIHLLEDDGNRIAAIKVMENHNLFEIAMSYKAANAERHLKRLDFK